MSEIKGHFEATQNTYCNLQQLDRITPLHCGSILGPFDFYVETSGW